MAEKSEKSGGIAETFKTIFWALFLAGIIRTILFQPFWIPSGSMKSTLLIGDFLFVNKFTYGYSWASCPSIRGFNFCGFAKDWDGRLFGGEPEQGDIIVFKHPASEADYIKRLIGLPGDKVQVVNGQLNINGAPVPMEPAGSFVETYDSQGPMGNLPACGNGAVGIGAECVKEQFVETLPNGVSHLTLNIGDRGGDNTPVYTVPEGHYFFMGDNRDNSTDSRFRQPNGVGFVPESYLIGRADRVMFSSAGSSILAFWTWRSDRFFKALQ
ncbi:signal peptidase I [Neptunicoccus cionae]|uniref:Signal peptidase I n=1 Tax=Neptunicoccus cionae TaxID=2035344 RepID=A0A916VTA7_9RHOB|nr:signal peptidase I [Amylibacter cionae]GGA30986.1 signal peptidase I [Amylibacter cionae]